MCGYCTEGLAIDYATKIAEGAIAQTDLNHLEVDDITAIIYLIESELDNFALLFHNMIQRKGARFLIDPVKRIAFCRLIETFMYFGYEPEKRNVILQHLTPQLWGNFFAEAAEHPELNSWSLLLKPESLKSEYNWSKFIKKDNLKSKSVDTLNFYYKWWILGKNLDLSNTKNKEKFNAIFPFAFISFLYLSQHAHESETIKKIALEPPKNIPDFEAFDLWLQRRAFVFCVREYGVHFIFEHYKNLRAELIAYALLKVYIDPIGLTALKDFFSKNKLEPQIIADSDYLLETVNDLLEIIK